MKMNNFLIVFICYLCMSKVYVISQFFYDEHEIKTNLKNLITCDIIVNTKLFLVHPILTKIDQI